MPQVSNLSWFYSILVCLLMYLILILFIHHFGIVSSNKNSESFISKLNFYFLI